MEGSSDSGWRKSASSRGLDASTSSERNLRLLHASRRSLSTDASRNSLFGSGRRARDSFMQAPSDYLRNRLGSSGVSEDEVAIDPVIRSIEWGDVSLRHWLDNTERSVDAIESLHIFKQIVEIVSTAHSQGIVLNNIRPSCFIMSSFNHVSFIESASCSDSGSDSPEDGLDGHNMETKQSCSSFPDDLLEGRSGLGYEDTQQIPEMSGSKSHVDHVTDLASVDERGWYETKDFKSLKKAGEKQPFPMKELLLMETSWYTSPEEIQGAPCSCASDIYRLGVLLFEVRIYGIVIAFLGFDAILFLPWNIFFYMSYNIFFLYTNVDSAPSRNSCHIVPSTHQLRICLSVLETSFVIMWSLPLN